MKGFALFFAAGIFVLGSVVSCKTVSRSASESKAESSFPPEGDFNLSKAETLLLYNPQGDWALVHIKEKPEIKSISGLPNPDGDPRLVHKRVSSKFSKFYVLGDSSLFTLDAETGAFDSKVEAPSGLGFAIEAKDKGYLFTEEGVQELDPQTGKLGRSVSAPVEAWTLTETEILVATPETFSIIAKDSLKVSETISLVGDKKLLKPILNVSYQKAGDLAYVTGSPKRPSQSGISARIDMKEKTFKDFRRSATFNGAIFALNKIGRAIELQHTSTPVSSTHVQLYDVQSDGNWETVGNHGTAFDLFEENNFMSFNEDETLGVMSSACFTGFCMAGKGLVFYDLKNDKRLPNLTTEALGFQNYGGFFAKP